jgi:hypothetical protein
LRRFSIVRGADVSAVPASLYTPDPMTRRLLPLSVAVSACMLAGCAGRNALEPEEVLRRAIIRGHTMDSASISAEATVRIDGRQSFSGSVVVQAVLQSGGTAWSADASFRGAGWPAGTDSSGRIRILTADGSRFFVKAESLQGALHDLLIGTQTGSQSGWWVTGDAALSPAPVRSAPSPDQLDRAAGMFEITGATGPKRGQGGRREYVLHVRLSHAAGSELFASSVTDKTETAGILVIDADDFTLRRSEWRISGLQSPLGTLNVSFDVSLTDFNRAPEIVIPSGSSAVLPLKEIFATFSG